MQRQAGIAQQVGMPERLPDQREDQPGISQVQRPQQRHPPQPTVVPARQAHAMQQRHRSEHSGQPGLRAQRQPSGTEQRDCDQPAQGQALQPGHGRHLRRQTQATLGEEGNHPAADQSHHRRHQPERGDHALTLPGIVAVHEAGNHQQVGQSQQDQHTNDGVVTHLAHRQQHAAEQHGDSRQEGDFQRNQQPQRRIQQPSQPRRQPEQRQGRQRPAGYALATGPGLRGSEQEAGDDRDTEAEQHLVAVPGQRTAGRLPVRPEASQYAEPEGNGQRGESRAGEEEGTKGEAPERRDLQQGLAVDQLHGEFLARNQKGRRASQRGVPTLERGSDHCQRRVGNRCASLPPCTGPYRSLDQASSAAAGPKNS